MIDQELKYRKFSPGSIVTGGEIGHRMALTSGKILDHTDIEETFARHFKVRKEAPEVFGGFSGYGMLLDAIVKASVHCSHRQTEMIRLKEKLISELKETQTPDGNISMYLDKIGGWDSHEQAYFIQALVRDHLYNGEKSSLETAEKIAGFLMARDCTPTLGLEEAFLMLYEVTERREYLEFTLKNFRLDWTAKEFDQIMPMNGLRHVYTYLARTCAQLKYLALNGTYSDGIRDSLERAIRKLRTGGYVCITGACSGMVNSWGEVWDFSQTGLGKTGETCAAAYLMRFCTAMLQYSGESVWGDIFERVMYNTFYAAQSQDGLNYKYFVPFEEKGEWYDKDTYCCPNNFKRMVYEIPESIFLQKENAILINLYSDAVLKTDQAEIRMETKYPDSGDVTLMVNGDFPLSLRVPSWCKEYRVRIGDEVIEGQAGTFLTIERDWRNTELHIEMQMPFRLIKGVAAQERKTALMKGPCVYGIPEDTNVCFAHRICSTIEHPFQLRETDAGAEIFCSYMGETPARYLEFKRFSETPVLQTYVMRRYALRDMIEEDELFSFRETEETYF